MSWSLLSHVVGVINLSIFLWVSLVNLVVGVTLQVVALPFDPKRKVCLWVNHLLWGRVLYRVLPAISLRRTATADLGPGPYVVVCNHTSVLDIPACMGLRIPLRVVGKQSLDRVFLLGRYMRFTRQILLGTSEASVQRFLAQSHQALRDGISVLIFPEGTRSLDARLARFNRGAFRVAKDAGVPVL
ncbi:MAG: 1-acyl-sn-glycerol-3-phosphate acyltransferase, partial [Deltaproteobacteria bacterium]|nr:1-acyl-sn-glycerol-3-phosphate acyltransferase [Deltaproteobacteria bacterium]